MLHGPGALPSSEAPGGVVFASRMTLPGLTNWLSGVLVPVEGRCFGYSLSSIWQEVVGFWTQFLILLLKIFRKW